MVPLLKGPLIRSSLYNLRSIKHGAKIEQQTLFNENPPGAMHSFEQSFYIRWSLQYHLLKNIITCFRLLRSTLVCPIIDFLGMLNFFSFSFKHFRPKRTSEVATFLGSGEADLELGRDSQSWISIVKKNHNLTVRYSN